MYVPQGTGTSTSGTHSTSSKKAVSGMASKEMNNAGPFLLGMLAGAAAGVVAGIMLAPDKGKTTRGNWVKSATDLGKSVGETIQNSRSKVEDMLKDVMGGENGNGSSEGKTAKNKRSTSQPGATASNEM